MPANVPEERCKPVESAHEVWIHKLIDLSRRNSLLYFRLMKPGTLDFSEAPAEPLRELLAGETVAASKLAPNLESEALKKSLRDIYRRALENLEEKGLSTLFLSFGMATWPALDGGRPPEAPALLLPVSITKKEGSDSYYLAAARSISDQPCVVACLAGAIQSFAPAAGVAAPMNGNSADAG